MNRIFQDGPWFPVADGTRVAPVLNPYDSNESGLPPALLEGASIALGEIAPASCSRPHLHPIVTQVTWVLEGALRVRMKSSALAAAYQLDLAAGQAALTEPMTFLQLANPDRVSACRVLYVVTPAYVHVPDEDGYQDAIVFDQTWDELTRNGFPLPHLDAAEIQVRRAAVLQRLRLLKAAGK